MVTKYNIILLVYESSVHEKIQPLHGPKERCRPLVLRKDVLDERCLSLQKYGHFLYCEFVGNVTAYCSNQHHA